MQLQPRHEFSLQLDISGESSQQMVMSASSSMRLQHGATIAIVDCHIKDATVWQQRMEQRALSDTGSERSHKPQSWAALQALVER